MQMNDEFHVLYDTHIQQVVEINNTVNDYYRKMIAVRKNCRFESLLVKNEIKRKMN